ncbi:hypothetical protein [Tatumella sp. OPLPL6]|uniref:hypothetical protein n=1 Tax=Tatumella sp. OPLPL6 TaxID=1928657 RepID=UPI000C18DF6B|nr:hypothetical protein [Tatumella sp. OPLPL6]PIJ43281.1 hypothetical protein BOM24_08920 [Tatumella sp. OPLPL6]
MALEIIETDKIGLTGSVKTRTGDKLNILITENDERAMIMLIQNGELEAFKYIPNDDFNGVVHEIVEVWSFDHLYNLLWPNALLTEKRALMIEGLVFFVETIVIELLDSVHGHVCEDCREEEHNHHEVHAAPGAVLH